MPKAIEAVWKIESTSAAQLFAAADRVSFAGPAAEPPFAAQAPTASRRPQIASCGFALRRGGRRAALPLAYEGTRRLSERTLDD